MKLIRYELTMNRKNHVGLIQGGFGLDILSEEDLKDINEHLPIPPIIKSNSSFEAYFTEDGNKRFGSSIVAIAKQNLASDKNILGLQLVEKVVEDKDIASSDIVHKDRWQVILRK